MDTPQAVTSAKIDLADNLMPGEKVLWQGKPERTAFVWRAWPLSIFGALLLATAIAYEGVILTTGAPGVLAIWGAPFMLAALYMLTGHYVVTHYEWENTEYLVTDRRVLILHGIFSSRLTVYNLFSLPLTQVIMHGHDIGNVMFKPAHGGGYGPGPGYQNMWPYPPDYNLGLLYVRDPQRVQALIERARGSLYGVRDHEWGGRE